MCLFFLREQTDDLICQISWQKKADLFPRFNETFEQILAILSARYTPFEYIVTAHNLIEQGNRRKLRIRGIANSEKEIVAEFVSMPFLIIFKTRVPECLKQCKKISHTVGCNSVSTFIFLARFITGAPVRGAGNGVFHVSCISSCPNNVPHAPSWQLYLSFLLCCGWNSFNQ